MRVTAEIPAWMIADGEYGGVAVGRQHEFGFALEPASIRARTRDPGLHQVDGSSAASASGFVRHSSGVPPVLDEGCVIPILAVTDAGHLAGTEIDVEGRLLVEPYLWVTDGMLWPTVPDGVRLWSVRGLTQLTDSASTSLGALPSVEAVDHTACYLVQLERP